MNTLGYVARQLDVLAKPKDKALPRVSTWSSKSFLFPHVSPRRSHSSPSLPPRPAPDPPTPPKAHLECVIDQILFIRVLLMVWDNLKSAWSSFFHRVKPHPSPLVHSVQKKTPFHLPKTLVLDLDETLIHSTSRPIPFHSSGSGLLSLGSFGTRNKGAGHMVEVVLGGRSTLYHVYKRPFVDFFLRTVCPLVPLVLPNFHFIRCQVGIHSLYSPHPCKSMQIPS